MRPQQKHLAKPGKLKFKTAFQDRIDRHTEKMLQQKEKQHQARQYDELFREKLETKDTKIDFPVTLGTGRIATSGKSVHGVDTCFKKELQKGDFIILTHPTLKTKEERPVLLILSDKSILLEEAFVDEQTAFGQFEYRKQSVLKPAEDLESDYQRRLEEIHRTKKIQKEKATMDVRTKKGMWSYVVRKQQVDKEASREDLLDKRSKIVKDKHCW